MAPTVLPPSHRSPKRRHVLGMGLGMLASSGLSRGAQAAKPVRVAAASDLKFVLTHLLDRFQQETGIPVQASFGSSGNFVRQIRQGLPVDLFMSADQAWVSQLIQAGLGRRLAGGAIDEGAIYGRGRIAIFLPRNSTLPLDARLQGLKDNWGQVSKFAIANPEHAPYGRAAREALMRLGLWELVAAKLVLGENIAQATQFVTTGAAQAGITALSLALAPELASQGRHLLLDEQLHAPLIQRMILLRGAQADAARLYDYLLQPAARARMRRYGLDNPA
ncbi:MAG: molybdate ABC transporter substrate-binding protein [Hylemonella sp.]